MILLTLLAESFDRVVKHNLEYLKSELKEGDKVLKKERKVDERPYKETMSANKKKISQLRTKIRLHKAGRAIKRTIAGAKIAKTNKTSRCLA